MKERQQKNEQRRMNKKIFSHSFKGIKCQVRLLYHGIRLSMNMNKKKYVIDFGDKIMSHIHAANLKVPFISKYDYNARLR